MGNFLALLDSTPFWGKVLIPYFIMIVCLLIDLCWATKQFKKDYIKIVLKASVGYYVIYGVSFYLLFFIAEFICKMIWGDLAFFAWVSAHTWISALVWLIPYLIIFRYIQEYMDSKDSKSSSSTVTYIPRNRPSNSRPASSRPASTPIVTKPSAPVQRPRVAPVVVPQKLKDPVGAVNMTNYENQVAKGIDIRLDFEPNYGRVGKAIQLMKTTGAKITFYNLDNVRSYDNLIHVAKQAPGQIIYERVFPANLAAISFAESGACFQCDCKSHSTAIKDIAKAAKRGGGLVTFINISWMSSFELKELRELGGSNVEFK